MAKRGFFRRISDFVTGIFKPKKRRAVKKPPTPAVEVEKKIEKAPAPPTKPTQAPTVHLQVPSKYTVAKRFIKIHGITNPQNKLRIVTNVGYMTDDQKREAMSISEAEIRQRAREQRPPTLDRRGDPVNPYWYH